MKPRRTAKRSTPNRSELKPKRGRPPKRVLPTGEPAAAPPPAVDPGTDGAIAAQLVLVRQRAATGARLAHHELRLLSTAWLHDQSLHIWPTLEAAAADLGVSPSSLRGYRDQGCPAIEPHQPIPKAPVLHWLLKRAHDRGGERFANKDLGDEADARYKLARAVEKEKSLITTAEDLAQQGLLAACIALRSRLTQALPGQLWDAAHDEADRTAGESRLAALIENAITDGARITPPTAPEGPTP